MGGGAQQRYRILVSRADTRPTADLYGFDLQELIPEFPLPLRPGDEEPLVALQSLLQGVYDRSGYDYFIDYTADPLPPLSDEERGWIDWVLQEKGLR